MLGIHYYVCPDSEHQVPHVWRLVTRGRRLVTALGTAQIAVHIASIKHRGLVTRKYQIHENVIDFRRRLVTALDAVLDASGVYMA